MKLKNLLVALSAFGFVQPAAAQAPTRPVLTLETAELAAQTCQTLAESRNWQMTITIVDRNGDPILVRRMNDAITRSLELSRLKAETAATVGVSTRDLRRILVEDSNPPHGLERVPGIIIFDGGVTVRAKNGAIVGGIGVSGASAADDGDCARAGLAAIWDRL